MSRRELSPYIPETGNIPPGSVISARRWYIGMGREDLASLTGYNPGYISMIETNHLPRFHENIGTLNIIAAAIGLKKAENILNAEREEVLKWIAERKDIVDQIGC